MRIVPGDQMMYEVPGTVLTELRDLRAEVARLREALRLIASGGCAIPSMKCIPGMSCSACIARDALAAPTVFTRAGVG